MRAAAQLAGAVADRDDPDLVAVLLAEQRHRAGLAGGVDPAHDLGVHREVVDEHRVDPLLDVGQHRRRHRRGRGEVEAEPAGGVLRAGLGRGLPQRLAERLVHQVGRGVRAGDRLAALEVDLGVRAQRRG